MDFQLVFGNPRKGKKKRKKAKGPKMGSMRKKKRKKAKKSKKKYSKKRAKKVSSKRKKKSTKRKTRRKSKKIAKKVSRKAPKASKRKSRRKRKKNPAFLRASKPGKKSIDSRVHTTASENAKLRGLFEQVKSAYRDTPISEREPGMIRAMKRVVKLQKQAEKKALTPSEQAYLESFAKKWSDKGYKVSKVEYAYGSKKPGSKKKKSKKTKKASKKAKGSTMAKRRKKRKKSRKTSVNVRIGKKSASTKLKTAPPLKKGESVSRSSKRGRKKFRTTFKRTNPLGASGMSISSYVPQLRNTAIGDVNLKAVAYLGAASALTGVLDASVAKVPYLGPAYGSFKAALSKAPVLASAAPALGVSGLLTVLEIVADKAAPGKYPSQLKEFNEALATVGLIHVASGLGQMIVKMIPGMSGVVYTPGLSGVVYTPELSGVRYTKELGNVQMWPNRPQRQFSGHPQMGAGADFGHHPAADYGGGDGYTEEHPRSNADFGGADYGPAMAGSHPQMGVVPQVMSGDEEPVLDQSMGSMG